MPGSPKGASVKNGNSLFNLWKSVSSVDDCFFQDKSISYKVDKYHALHSVSHGLHAPMKVLEKPRAYQQWFEGLQDKQIKARILVRIARLQNGNAGDVAPEGEGVSELRLHFGSGWRVYYTERNGQIIILLAGGNKSTQSKDIKLAQMLACNL